MGRGHLVLIGHHLAAVPHVVVDERRACSGPTQLGPPIQASSAVTGFVVTVLARTNMDPAPGTSAASTTRTPLADLSDQKLWRANPTADYGPLDRAARGKIDLSRGSGGVASFTVRASWWTSAARTSRVSVFVQSIPLARGDGRPDGSCAYFPIGVRGIGYPSK